MAADKHFTSYELTISIHNTMKSRLPKKVVSIVVFVVPIIILIVTPALALANEPFVPIVGIPGVSATPDFNSYVNALYLLSISLAALLAVVKIILAGVQWMFSDVVTDISLAKQNIRGALIGLLIVMSAVLVLRTINPDLTTLKALGDRDDIKFSGGSEKILIRDNRSVGTTATTVPCGENGCDDEISNCNGNNNFLDSYINFLTENRGLTTVSATTINGAKNSITCTSTTLPNRQFFNTDDITSINNYESVCLRGGGETINRGQRSFDNKLVYECLPLERPNIPVNVDGYMTSSDIFPSSGSGDGNSDLYTVFCLPGAENCEQVCRDPLWDGNFNTSTQICTISNNFREARNNIDP